jgi:hypothetical protein
MNGETDMDMMHDRAQKLQRATMVLAGAMASGNARRIAAAQKARTEAHRALFSLTRAIRAAQGAR